MNSSPGKIFLLLIIPIWLMAKVSVSVDKPVVYIGDKVTFTITAEGKDAEFPDISMIDGTSVLSTSSSSDIRIINGNYSKSISKSYLLAPKKTLHIPAYDVTVDGKIEKTEALEVKTVKPSKNPDAAVVLDLKLEKKEAYVGEAVRFDLVFKQRYNVHIDQLQIEEPKFEDFWIKKIDGVRQGNEGEYITQTYSYLLFAQKSGTLTIPAVSAEVGQAVRQRSRGGMNDPFFNSFFSTRMQVSKVFSNDAVLDVKALPGNLELFGNFSIKAGVDKYEVNANKPVNLTISIDGVGNLDDIKKYTLDIDGTIVYANKPEIHTRISGTEYLGSFEQKIAIIADSNYTIPAQTLRYFDRDTHREVVKQTGPIKITVVGGVAKQTEFVAAESSEIETAELPEQKSQSTPADMPADNIQLLSAAAIGFGIGALFSWLMMRNRLEHGKQKKKITTMEQNIVRAKSDKALFELLLPHKKESRVIDEFLVKLEENLYRGKKNSIDKKALIAHFRGEGREIEFV
jgi:hypothetical protein